LKNLLQEDRAAGGSHDSFAVGERLYVSERNTSLLWGETPKDRWFQVFPEVRELDASGTSDLRAITADADGIYGIGFDAKSIYWDATGATKKSFPDSIRGASVVSDHSGVLWSASLVRDGSSRLRLVGFTRDGQVLVDQVVAPHELTQTTPVIKGTKDTLIVACGGMYQGEEHLLLFSFKST